MREVQFLTKVALIITCAFVVAGIFPCTSFAQAEESKSPWMVRMRLLAVEPDDSSSTITTIGGKAGVDNGLTGDVDFSYFFTDNIAAELTLAVTEHSVRASNTAAGNVDLGKVKLLPPTLTLQYHLAPDAQYRPYIGAGVNYTIFFDEEGCPSSNTIALKTDYEDAFGLALQAGIDIGITEKLAINFDVKKIFLQTEATVTTTGPRLKTDVDIDPWLIGVGLSYRF